MAYEWNDEKKSNQIVESEIEKTSTNRNLTNIHLLYNNSPIQKSLYRFFFPGRAAYSKLSTAVSKNCKIKNFYLWFTQKSPTSRLIPKNLKIPNVLNFYNHSNWVVVVVYRIYSLKSNRVWILIIIQTGRRCFTEFTLKYATAFIYDSEHIFIQFEHVCSPINAKYTFYGNIQLNP